MLSLILGMSGAANILLALLYKHRCEKEKRNKDSLLDDLVETKRCYHKTTEKVRELEKSCFDKEMEIIELKSKASDYKRKIFELINDNTAFMSDNKNFMKEIEELKGEIRESNRAIDKQASIMKAMHRISREVRDDKEALRLRNIDLERKLDDTRTLLGYKEEELKKSNNIKQGALETLKGFLSMNREDRRTFAKSGMIPADLIKFDKELMEEVE